MSASDDRVIFVSYRTTDSPTAADAVYSELNRVLDIEIFKDTESIHVGEPITDAVREHLSRAKVLVLVIGPNWYKPREESQVPPIHTEDDWVRAEIRTALEQKIPIVPVYVEAAKRLKARDLPKDVRPIAELAPDSQGVAPKSVVISTEHPQLDLGKLAQDLAAAFNLPRKPTLSTSGPIGAWRPSREWQLRHLERLKDQLAMLSPAIPPRGTTRQEWPLSAVFVPLELLGPRGRIAEGEIDWGRLIKADRVVLTGGAGAGKSTLLRHLVLTATERRRAQLTRDGARSAAEGEEPADPLSRIPVWIHLPSAAQEIRQAREGATRGADGDRPAPEGAAMRSRWFKNLVADEWLDPVASAARLDKRDEARALLDTGEVLLVFDGLDEIANGEERRALVESLSKLPSAYGGLGVKNPVIVGCRDKAWERGGPFAPFEQFQVQPMDRPKWEAYLDRWCRAVWEDDADHVLRELKRALRTSRAVQDMATNPQTATMLAVLARDGELPQQRVHLYDEFIGCALANGRLGQYGSQSEVRGHLVALAVDLQNSAGSTDEPSESLSENRARSILGARRLPEGKRDLTEREIRELGAPLLADIELHTGLVSIDRSEAPRSARTVVRFRHRTMQEFLVACHYVDDPDGILEHTREPAWLVPIALTAGLLAKDEAHEDLKRFLRQLVQKPALESSLAKEALVQWGERLAVLSACLEELSSWPVDDQTLAPAREAYEGVGRLLEDFDLVSRVAIAEGMGILGDPRLGPARASRWVEIEACSSLIGSDSEEAWVQEGRVRKVRLSPYRIQRWPVTVGEYARFLEDTDGYKDDQWWDEAGLRWRNEHGIETPEGWERSRAFGNRPVTGVSWWETRAYTRWLTSVETLPEGWAVTLPTEAQWERAARGPFDSPTHVAGRFPWGKEWDREVERANCDQILRRVCPVGLFPHGNSPEAIWDLSGNVGERCLDGFGPPDLSESLDPCHTDHRFGHSVRGGDYASPVLNARVSARFPDPQGARSDRIGFRCVAWRAPQELR